MIREYYDTSAFAKLFIQEAGSEEVLKRYREATEPTVSRLALVEVRSAVQKAMMMGLLTFEDAQTVHAAIDATIAELSIIALSNGTFTRAERIVKVYSLRTLDALHLACAMGLDSIDELTFVSCDRKLIEAALAEGLRVIDQHLNPAKSRYKQQSISHPFPAMAL